MSSWHQMTITEVLSTIKSDKDYGLSKAEANRRLAEHGPNELEVARRSSPWSMLGEQFKNILIIKNE